MERAFKIKTHFEYSDESRTAFEPIGCENVYMTGTLYKDLFGRPLKGTDRLFGIPPVLRCADRRAQ